MSKVPEHKYKIVVVYEVKATDRHSAISHVQYAINYGKEETAHSCASKRIKHAYISGEPERI